MRILTFGNPAVPGDDLAHTVGDALVDSYETRRVDDPLTLIDEDLSDAVLIDVAYGISEPKLLDDPERLRLQKTVTLHDIDLAYLLKLLKRLDKLPRVRIIALPYGSSPTALVEKTRALLERLENRRNI